MPVLTEHAGYTPKSHTNITTWIPTCRTWSPKTQIAEILQKKIFVYILYPQTCENAQTHT